jgi:hypothetical protein
MPDISQPKLDIIIAVGIIFLLLVMLYNHRRVASASAKDSAELGVQDLIEKVKSELIKTEQSRVDAGQAPLFELKDFELEISFVVKTSDKESGKAEFEVVTVGGETEFSSEKIQKIKLHMTAVQPQLRQAASSTAPPAVEDSAIISDPPPEERKRNGRRK